MADVIVACTEDRGVTCVLLAFANDQEPCPSVSPLGVPCAYGADHDGHWHLGFREENLTLPTKWPADKLEGVLAQLAARLAGPNG